MPGLPPLADPSGELVSVACTCLILRFASRAGAHSSRNAEHYLHELDDLAAKIEQLRHDARESFLIVSARERADLARKRSEDRHEDRQAAGA